MVLGDNGETGDGVEEEDVREDDMPSSDSDSSDDDDDDDDDKTVPSHVEVSKKYKQ